jgi:hypothetical protein
VRTLAGLGTVTLVLAGPAAGGPPGHCDSESAAWHPETATPRLRAGQAAGLDDHHRDHHDDIMTVTSRDTVTAGPATRPGGVCARRWPPGPWHWGRPPRPASPRPRPAR